MNKNLSLDELNTVEQKLELWIKSHQSFLGEFQDYYCAWTEDQIKKSIKNKNDARRKEGKPQLTENEKKVFADDHSKLSFNIRGYFNSGTHTPFESVTLDEYRDKEGKRLSEKEKSDIIYKVNFIEKLKKRLQLIRDQRMNLFLGEDFFTNEPGEPSKPKDYNDSAKTIIKNLKEDKKYKSSVKAWGFKTLLGKYCEQHYQDYHNKLGIQRTEFCKEIFPEFDKKLNLSKNLPNWDAKSLDNAMKHSNK